MVFISGVRLVRTSLPNSDENYQHEAITLLCYHFLGIKDDAACSVEGKSGREAERRGGRKAKAKKTPPTRL